MRSSWLTRDLRRTSCSASLGEQPFELGRRTADGDRVFARLPVRHLVVREATTWHSALRINIVEVVEDEPAVQTFAGLGDGALVQVRERLSLILSRQELVEPSAD